MPKKPTRKMLAFVEAYLKSWNASAAAREAGYSERTLTAIGFEVLKKPAIQAIIQARMAANTMQTNEVLARLTQQAQLDISEFMLFEEQLVHDVNGKVVIQNGVPLTRLEMIGINWAAVMERGYLVKAVKYDRAGRAMLEFHDAQAALLNIGKHLKLFSEQIDLNMLTSLKAYVNVSPDDWDAPAKNGLEE